MADKFPLKKHLGHLGKIIAIGGALELMSELKNFFSSTRREKEEEKKKGKKPKTKPSHLGSALQRGSSYITLYLSHLLVSSLLRRVAPRMVSKERRWIPAALCSMIVQAISPSFPGVFCLLLLVSNLGRYLETRLSRFSPKGTLNLLWAIVGSGLGFQLWHRFHTMPTTWQKIMVRGSGAPSKALHYRSESGIIVPCDDPEYGIHPGVNSCLSASVRDALHGLPSVAGFRFICQCAVSLVQLQSKSKRAEWKKKPLKTLWNSSLYPWLLSTASLTTQIAIGRSAFCFQSNFRPEQRDWWVGPLFAAFASLFAAPQAFVKELVMFDAGNILFTEISYWTTSKPEMRRFFYAILLGLATAANFLAPGGMVLPVLLEAWKE